MKLRPILRADAHQAASLLSEGFPVHPLRTWQESIRMLLSHAERGGNEPIGHIASAGGRDVGIGLAIPGRRTAYEDRPRKVVNLAAFYMRPGNEWMTTPFLRRMMKDPATEYVDLTASVAMREVNRRLGFTDRSRGVVVVPTALSAMRPGRGARIVPVSGLPAGKLSPDHHALLAEHARLQGIALAVEVDGACHPLILAWSCRKRVWGARVVLAKDRELIRTVLGPLSRHLLGLGILFLEFDAMSKAGIPEAAFVTRFAPVQSTMPSANPAIDHTFSELMFIPPPTARPAFALPRQPHGRGAFPFPLEIADAGFAAIPAATALIIGLTETIFV